MSKKPPWIFLLLALDLDLPVPSDFLIYFSLDVEPDEPEFKLDAIWLFTWKWSFFNFPFAEKVSPSPSIPALQLRKYCNEWKKSNKYWIVKRAEYFYEQMQNIYLGAVENRRCSSPTIQIAVCQSAGGLRVSPLKFVSFYPTNLSFETYYGSETKRTGKTFKKNCQW